MVSNYEDKSLKSILPEGKRHYQTQKKTSLYGSESPKHENSRVYKPRPENNIFGYGEEQILNQNNSRKFTSDQEKRETLEELKRYNPWGKPGAGAPNTNNFNNNNRAKWEYEQKMNIKENVNGNSNESFPGFGGSFGSGKMANNSRRRSDQSKSNETQQRNYFPFGSSNDGPEMTGSNNHEATLTHKNDEHGDDIMYKKYEETKSLADDLEKEIQRLKLQKLEEKYAAMNNHKNSDNTYPVELDNEEKLNYDDDALYREAEYRARLRQLDKMKDSYSQDYPDNESNSFLDSDVQNKIPQNADAQTRDKFSFNEQKRQINNKNDSLSINRNAYRPYTVEELMNSRPQMVNPALNKRTTLSGSEDRRPTYDYNSNEYNNSNINHTNGNMQIIDEDNIIRKFSKSNTHSNLFPSERNYSPIKASSAYQTKAPYATD